MRAGDHVYVRVDGTIDTPEFRPGFLIGGPYADGTWAARVLLGDRDFRLKMPFTQSECRAGSAMLLFRHGQGVGEFWTIADFGIVPEKRYTLNQTKPGGA